MFLDIFPTGPIQANCTLLGDTEKGELVVIDPGEEAERIVSRIEASGLRPTMLLHTHGHMDHAGGTSHLHTLLGGSLPVGLHREDVPLFDRLPAQGRMFGLELEAPPPPDLWLEHQQILEVGSLRVEVRHAPGHSPGSVLFVIEDQATVIVGDVLFAGSIGRTDLWGGSLEVLEASIREQLYSLPDDTRVITGHGPDTTIGQERTSNPFVRG